MPTRSPMPKLFLPPLFALLASVGTPTSAIGQELEDVPVECQPNLRVGGRPPLPGARGCSALDVVQTPGIFIDPLRQTLADAGDEIARGAAAGSPATKDLARVAKRIVKVEAALARAGDGIEAAKVCKGARLVTGAGKAIERLARGAEAKIARIGRARGDEDAGDATAIGGRQAALRLFADIFLRMGPGVDELRTILDGLCAAIGRPHRVRAVVVKIDDARRRLRLADGRVVGLHSDTRAGGLWAGASVQAKIRDLPGGDGLADSMTVDVAAGDAPPVNPYLGCIELALAPIQPFYPPFVSGEAMGTNGRAGLVAPPPGAEPYVLHRLVAYEWPVVGRVFETGMRFGALKRPCFTDALDTSGQFHRYSLDLSITQAGETTELANQLEPGDAPAPWGQGLQSPGIATIAVAYKQQLCTLQATRVPWTPILDTDAVRACNPATTECACDPNADYCPMYHNWDDLDDFVEPYDCTVPTVYETKGFTAVIVERGSICDATYATRFFDIEDHLLDAYRVGNVSGVDVSDPIGSVATQFWADGFAPATPQQVFPGRYVAELITVSGGQDFGVFGWEPCPPVSIPGQATLESNCFFPEDKKTALQNTGAATASALRWPRIVGINNAKQFAYSCKLPAPLVRDTLAFCSGPDEYYRWPLAGGPWAIGQGNCACDCAGCMGCTCTHACGCTQHFAFDVTVASNTPIYAARGGKVVAAQKQATQNCWKAACNGPGGAWGNYVTIEHQDGSAASYMHMPFLLGGGVSVGDYVKRGHQIGYSDNTGNSSDPHLHFQEQVSKSNDTTQQMRFELNVLFDPRTCYTPTESDFILSSGVPAP